MDNIWKSRKREAENLDFQEGRIFNSGRNYMAREDFVVREGFE